jgi:hypothetical protein
VGRITRLTSGECAFPFWLSTAGGTRYGKNSLSGQILNFHYDIINRVYDFRAGIFRYQSGGRAGLEPRGAARFAGRLLLDFTGFAE